MIQATNDGIKDIQPIQEHEVCPEGLGDFRIGQVADIGGHRRHHFTTNGPAFSGPDGLLEFFCTVASIVAGQAF